MMLLAVISPVLRCEWQLEQLQVAYITTVSTDLGCFLCWTCIV